MCILYDLHTVYFLWLTYCVFSPWTAYQSRALTGKGWWWLCRCGRVRPRGSAASCPSPVAAVGWPTPSAQSVETGPNNGKINKRSYVTNTAEKKRTASVSTIHKSVQQVLVNSNETLHLLNNPPTKMNFVLQSLNPLGKLLTLDLQFSNGIICT